MKQSNENKLIENEDFYLTPEGYKCFTAQHHLKRGIVAKVVADIARMVLTKKLD